jgi:hypothetical protein
MYSRCLAKATESFTRTSENPFCQIGRPYSEFRARAESESTLCKLHRTFDGNSASDCDQQMKMIRNDNKLMQAVPALRPIFIQSSHKQFDGTGGLQHPAASPSCRSDKECSFAAIALRGLE